MEDETPTGRAIRLIREDERERCAKIAENPGFIEGRDSEWDEGVNYAKRFIADAIRRGITVEKADEC